LLSSLALVLAGTVGGGALLYTYAGELPSLDNLSTQDLDQSTKIYARDGTTLLAERFADERRTVVPLSAMSEDLRHATLAIEDKDFYRHAGVSPVRVVAAALYDITHRRAVQGGSTITQQVVKNYLTARWGASVGSQRSLTRKAREWVFAIELERRYTKDQILELYLNTIPYGNQAAGIESAAQTYFRKPAKDLDLAEASFLAGLPQRPTFYSPFRPEGLKHARDRQRDVLDAMVRGGYITAAEADKAYGIDLQPRLTAAKTEFALGSRSRLAPHFVEYVWQELENRYDASLLLRGGLRIVTTLDPKTQELAVQSVQEGVQKFSGGYGVNNGAMLVMNPHTGEVLAMVGSADYNNADIGGQVNYTTARRQPGSSFKPYTYVTALLNGWNPGSILDDSNGKAFTNFPPDGLHDWDGKELGKITLRESLQKSRNISSVRLFQDVGMDSVLQTARRLGITGDLQPVPSVTLGSKELRMTEHLSAYSAFANGGTRVRPVAVLEIRDARNQVLEKTDLRPDTGERVLAKGATYILTDLLKGAVNPVLPIPVAAKSGTTTDFKDAWYIGYSTDLAVATWMGRTVSKPAPRNEPMFGRGGGLWGEIGPGFVWHQFMTAYYRGRKPADWTKPDDVVMGEVCKTTGFVTETAVQDLVVSEMFVKPVPAPKPCAPLEIPPLGADGAPPPSQPPVLPSLTPLPPLPPGR